MTLKYLKYQRFFRFAVVALILSVLIPLVSGQQSRTLIAIAFAAVFIGGCLLTKQRIDAESALPKWVGLSIIILLIAVIPSSLPAGLALSAWLPIDAAYLADYASSEFADIFISAYGAIAVRLCFLPRSRFVGADDEREGAKSVVGDYSGYDALIAALDVCEGGSDEQSQAAFSGDYGTCFNHGLRHKEGDSVKKDNAIAAYWFEEASRAANTPPSKVAYSLHEAGQCYRLDGNYEKARGCYREAAKIFRELGDDEALMLASSLDWIGFCYWYEESWEDAKGAWSEELNLLEQYRGPKPPNDAENVEAKIARVSKNIPCCDAKMKCLGDLGGSVASNLMDAL